MKSDLSCLQKDFQAHVMGKINHTIQSHIQSTKKNPVNDRLEIYRNAYLLRLTEILAEDYSALATLLGKEKFSIMAQTYIEAFPSKFRSARWFGTYLTNFLQTTTPYALEPALAEMAMFEWQLVTAFDAQDIAILGIDDIAKISQELWPSLVFTLHPTVKLLKIEWNVVELWQRIHANKKNKQVKKLKQALTYLIWREGYESYFRPLDNQESWALQALSKNADFTTLCQGLCQFVDEVEASMVAATFLKRWLHDGLIVGVR